MTAATDVSRWTRLCTAARLSGECARWYERLATSYSEPHRHYHTLRHLAECFSEFDAAQHLASDPIALGFALWFHDAIYDSQAHDSEQRSAELAARFLTGSGANPDLTMTVSKLILATKHVGMKVEGDASLLVDIDLSILGQPKRRFDEYELAIRKEFEWVPEAVFRSKRSEILQRFLARDRIYATDWFAERYELQARRNVERSLLALGR